MTNQVKFNRELEMKKRCEKLQKIVSKEKQLASIKKPLSKKNLKS
jgi:hypothetical protein